MTETYGQAIKDTIFGRMVSCEEQGKGGESFFSEKKHYSVFMELLNQTVDVRYLGVL